MFKRRRENKHKINNVNFMHLYLISKFKKITLSLQTGLK